MARDFTNWNNFLKNVGASQFEKLDETQEQSEPITLESLSAESDRQRELLEKKKLEEEEAKRQRKKEQANKRKDQALSRGLATLRNKRGESLTEILTGLRQGQPLEFLFLLATRRLSQLLSQEHVGAQIERELIAIYGIGLENSEVLDLKLEEIKERKTNLENVLELKSHLMKDDEKKRLKNAIQEHENEIQRLETLKKKEWYLPTEQMIEILEKWVDETYSKMDYYSSNPGEKFAETWWYWNLYHTFLFDFGLELESLKAHDSPQDKKAAMLNRTNSEAFFFQDEFDRCDDQIKAQAHIDASLKAKELFTAWDPTGDPIRKYKVFRRN